MLINILDISRKPEGSTETRVIHIDSLEDVELANPLEGEVEITVIHPRLFSAHLYGSTAISRECDRCLVSYDYPMTVDFFAEFADEQEDGDWPILKNQIDLSEPIRQEILLSLPARSLHSPDCKGILE